MFAEKADPLVARRIVPSKPIERPHVDAKLSAVFIVRFARRPIGVFHRYRFGYYRLLFYFLQVPVGLRVPVSAPARYPYRSIVAYFSAPFHLVCVTRGNTFDVIVINTLALFRFLNKYTYLI